MLNNELLGLEWKNKLIDDLGLEKYNKLFSKSIEDIVISPFYTENNEPINILIPEQWNILGEVNEVKFIEARNEINEFLKNDINHIILNKNPKLDTKKIIEKFNNSDVSFFIKTDCVNDLNKLKDNTHLIIFEQSLENDEEQKAAAKKKAKGSLSYERRFKNYQQHQCISIWQERISLASF